MKLWINDTTQTERVLKHVSDVEYHSDSEGLLKRITGRFKNFKASFEVLHQRLELGGSIHKYWNGGTNENDFTFSDAKAAILQFCKELELDPAGAKVVNLEFGVNLTPALCASTLIDQIICFNYEPPSRPYRLKHNFYFIEFELTDYYLKIYDKGKQYKDMLQGGTKILRVEAKAVKSRVLKQAAHIETLVDLINVEKMQLLGVKLAKIVSGIVFDDDTIKPKDLNKKDRRLYRELKSDKAWMKLKGNTTSTTGYKVRRFKYLVEQYGERKLYSLISAAVKDKILKLTTVGELAVITPKYSVKPTNLNPTKPCLSCGRDISHQHPSSKYCSAKFVGEEAAHKCRNDSSNSRNNLKRRIRELERKGLLFDIVPYLTKVPA